MLDARFLINAVGSLNIPKLPDMPGRDTFAGRSFPRLAGPMTSTSPVRFGLVGAGATGFQIGPRCAERVDHLTVFQRTAQWIIPNPLYHAGSTR